MFQPTPLKSPDAGRCFQSNPVQRLRSPKMSNRLHRPQYPPRQLQGRDQGHKPPGTPHLHTTLSVVMHSPGGAMSFLGNCQKTILGSDRDRAPSIRPHIPILGSTPRIEVAGNDGKPAQTDRVSSCRDTQTAMAHWTRTLRSKL